MLIRNLFLICASVLVFCVGVTRPLYNWDMIGYVASAYYADGFRGAELSHRTYGAVRREVNRETFEWLTHDGKYEESVFKSPASLEEQLPFYSVRVAYIESMRALKSVGVEYPQATYLISAFFAALSLIVLNAIISAARIPFLTFPVVVVAAGFAHLSRLSTPDALACCFSLWAMYCLLSKNKLVFVLSAVLPLLRTDAVLLSALLMAYTFWRGERALSCVSLLFALAEYLLVNRWAGNYGLLTVFNFYFFQLAPFPAEMTISHNPADYLPPYGATFRDLLIEPGAQTLIYLLCIYVLIMHRDEARKFSGRHAFFTIPLCFIVLRLVAFPNYEDRFFVFPAAMILAGTLGVLTNALKSRGDAPRARA